MLRDPIYMSHDTTSPWDFSRVLDLVNSLSSTTPASAKSVENGGILRTTRGEDEQDEAAAGLGNFSKVWEYLGAPKDAPAPIVPVGEALDFSQLPGREDYASDGAIYRSTTKEVKWKDQTDDPPISPTLEESEGAKSPTTTTKLEKRRRKKQRRKERAEAERLDKIRAKSDLDTDIEQKAALGAPAKRASVHTLGAPQTPNSSQRKHLPKETPNGGAVPPLRISNKRPSSVATPFPSQTLYTPASPLVSGPNHTDGYAISQDNPSTPAIQTPVRLETPRRTDSNISAVEHLNQQLQQKWTPPSSTPYSSILAAPAIQLGSSRSAFAPSSARPNASSSAANPPHRRAIQPLSLRTGEDRYWALMLKLIADFPSDIRTLVSPSLLINHSSNPTGIHVFVDASNIFIGFHDQLKRARGIPVAARVPRVDLSFASLALLLERRRPVAKRVLAGSTPTVPAFDEAERIGYELNVLDKVQKVKELTARQKYFEAAKTTPAKSPNLHRQRQQQQQQQQQPVRSANTEDLNNTSTESDTTASNAAKWVEQGVDEILHLKILESVVDVEDPTTIVLATGDAAEAEYSQGFLRMVERALVRGWSVELVSWSRNISAAYKRRAWVEEWGNRFRVIALDDYAEELLEM